MPEYKLKPLPSRSSGMMKGEAKRKQEKQKVIDSERKEKIEEKRKKERHENIISTNEKIAGSIEVNTDRITQALSQLKEQIAKIELEVPELLEGDKISNSMSKNAENLEKTLKSLSSQISKIKIEVQKPIDMDKHTKSITSVINKNSIVSNSILEDIISQIAEIKLESDKPITHWSLEWSERDSNGFTKKVDLIAVEDTRILN